MPDAADFRENGNAARIPLFCGAPSQNRRLLTPPPQPKRNAERLPPARGAGARQHDAKGAGRRHCRPAGGRPLLMGLPPSARTFAPIETKQSAQAPTRGAWARLPRAEGAGRRRCRPPTRGARARLLRAEGAGRRHCRPAALTYISASPYSAYGEARAPCGSWASRSIPRTAS